VGDRLRALGVEPSGIASDELRRLIEADIKLTADVVKAARAGLKSLTAQDFATAAEWRAWLAKEKK